MLGLCSLGDCLAIFIKKSLQPIKPPFVNITILLMSICLQQSIFLENKYIIQHLG